MRQRECLLQRGASACDTSVPRCPPPFVRQAASPRDPGLRTPCSPSALWTLLLRTPDARRVLRRTRDRSNAQGLAAAGILEKAGPRTPAEAPPVGATASSYTSLLNHRPPACRSSATFRSTSTGSSPGPATVLDHTTWRGDRLNRCALRRPAGCGTRRASGGLDPAQRRRWRQEAPRWASFRRSGRHVHNCLWSPELAFGSDRKQPPSSSPHRSTRRCVPTDSLRLGLGSTSTDAARMAVASRRADWFITDQRAFVHVLRAASARPESDREAAKAGRVQGCWAAYG